MQSFLLREFRKPGSKVKSIGDRVIGLGTGTNVIGFSCIVIEGLFNELFTEAPTFHVVGNGNQINRDFAPVYSAQIKASRPVTVAGNEDSICAAFSMALWDLLGMAANCTKLISEAVLPPLFEEISWVSGFLSPATSVKISTARVMATFR